MIQRLIQIVQIIKNNLKTIIFKDKKNWWEVEKIKSKHPSVIIPTSKWFEENHIQDGIYWTNNVYSEFSSFGFVWDSKEKKKKKERKDVEHLVVIILDVENTNDNK